MSGQVDRLTAITSQLVGDISRLPGVTLDQAGESQLVQLLTDAFEVVGHVALDEGERLGRHYDASCPLADCALDYPHLHQNLLQVTAHPGDITT